MTNLDWASFVFGGVTAVAICMVAFVYIFVKMGFKNLKK